MTEISRKTFITVGGVGLGALLAGVSGGAAFANPVGGPMPAVPPAPSSGGTPPGPYMWGWAPDDILAFDPETIAWARHLRCLVPRAERIAPFAPTQAHPDLDPATQLSTLSLDDAGTIYEGHSQPIGLEEYVYTQRFWPYIDILGTWHGQVKGHEPITLVDGERVPDRPYGVIDIPNPGWTEAAHRNGARSIGGWFWPRSFNFSDFLVRNRDGSFPVADKLIEMRKFFGFDGLFINQEATVTPAQIKLLQDMWRYLKRVDPDFYLQGYDSAHFDQGYVTYENRLSANNLRWLGTPEEPIYDSIFMNYWWRSSLSGGADPDLSKSAASAIAAGYDPRAVGFAGVEHQKGGFRPEEDFGMVAGPGKPAPTSVALFVEDQIWHNATRAGTTATPEGRAKYRDFEQKFWSGPTGNPATSGRLEPRTGPPRTDIENYRSWDGIAHWITERSPYGALPILTEFNIGVGSGFWLAGTKVRNRGWDNMGSADRALSWQYWTEGDLSVTLDETLSWGSAHSLKLAGSGVLHLFKTDIATPRAIAAKIYSQGLTKIDLGLTYQDDPSNIVWMRMRGRSVGEWHKFVATVPRNPRRIARVSVRTSGSGNLGQVLLSELGVNLVPRAATGFRIETAQRGPLPRTGHFSFEWNLVPGAVAYDVFQTDAGKRIWLGRCSRDVFFAEALNYTRGSTFELVTIAADGTRSKPAHCALSR